MKTSDLISLIEKISSTQNIEKEKILNEVAEIIKLKYGEIIIEKQRNLVDELKNKIITRLYNFEDHSVELKKIPRRELYKADRVEADYIEKAENELIAEGLLRNYGNSLQLTDAGIVKYKSFYGEI